MFLPKKPRLSHLKKLLNLNYALKKKDFILSFLENKQKKKGRSGCEGYVFYISQSFNISITFFKLKIFNKLLILSLFLTTLESIIFDCLSAISNKS